MTSHRRGSICFKMHRLHFLGHPLTLVMCLLALHCQPFLLVRYVFWLYVLKTDRYQPLGLLHFTGALLLSISIVSRRCLPVRYKQDQSCNGDSTFGHALPHASVDSGEKKHSRSALVYQVRKRQVASQKKPLRAGGLPTRPNAMRAADTAGDRKWVGSHQGRDLDFPSAARVDVSCLCLLARLPSCEPQAADGIHLLRGGNSCQVVL
jgi:hypothetical protein